MEQIDNGIYYDNTFPGVTLGAIVAPYGTIMIDSPLRNEDARTWRAMLLNMGISTKRYLVNLDAHPDRTLGSRALESTVIAHINTAEELRFRPSVFKGQNLISGADWEINDQVIGTRWVYPIITFDQHLLLHLDTIELVLEHHSGPTTGSIWAIIPSAKIIFVGDTVVPDQPPFLAQADLPSWIESLNLLVKDYRNYTIISGRGGIVETEVIRSQRTFLNKTLNSLERLANRESPPDKTERIVKRLLKDFTIPPQRRNQYTHRLRHGLFQYYSNHYIPGKVEEND